MVHRSDADPFQANIYMKKTKSFTSFYKFEEFLNSLGLFRMKLGLERMKKGLELLGIRPDGVPLVQIVGTNGKGSTACFLEAIARKHGLRTGLYTSPHLVSPKERIRVNSSVLSGAVWLDAANRVLEACRCLDLSYFEFLTLMAVLIFRQEKVDLAIMEAGLGGRHDATSALDPVLNVFTSTGLDHTHILGSTLEKIAMDKSMAMKGAPAVLARQEAEAMEVFRARALKTGAVIHSVQDHFHFERGGLSVKAFTEIGPEFCLNGFEGSYQMENAALALLGWKVLAAQAGYPFDPWACASGLKTAFWPGRLHLVSRNPLVMLDGAHNTQAMTALKASLDALGIRPGTIVFSCLGDKDVVGMSAVLEDMGAETLLIPSIGENPRAMPARELVLRLGGRASVLEDAAGYLRGLKKDNGPVLVCGSLYLLGEIYRAFPGWLRR